MTSLRILAVSDLSTDDAIALSDYMVCHCQMYDLCLFLGPLCPQV